MALGKKRLEIKRLVRQAKARNQGESAAKPPKEVILPSAPPARSAPASRPDGDTETSIPAVQGRGVDPSAETEAAAGTEPALPVEAGAILPPMPPDSLPFDCPCGAKLSAPRAAYDKKTRCPKCNAQLLLNLVEDPHGGPFRLEPFQTGK